MRLRIVKFSSVVDCYHLTFAVSCSEIVFFFFEVAVLVWNTVEELLDEEGLQHHVDHGHEDEGFSCEVLVKPLVATSCAGKISTFANEDFSDEDDDNLADRQNHSEAIVGSHLVLEDQTRLVALASVFSTVVSVFLTVVAVFSTVVGMISTVMGVFS